MNYHAMIMNIRQSASAQLRAGGYEMGHRDARHAAAEITARADVEIWLLKAERRVMIEALTEIAEGPHMDDVVIAQMALAQARP